MDQQKLNVKLLSWTCVALVLAGTGVHLLHGFQVAQHADTLRAQADQAEKEGRLDRAATYLGRSLILAPDDTDTLARYGLTLDRLASTPAEGYRALAVLEDALAKAPDRRDVRRQLAYRAMALGQYPRARTHLEELLRAAPGNGELEGLVGQCLEAGDDFDGAAAFYGKAIQHAPAQVDNYVRLAELLRHRLDQPEKAGQVMDDLVKANPGAFHAHLARARYQVAYGTLTAAARDVKEAARLAPSQADVVQAGAALAQLRGLLDEARHWWQRGLELHPGDRRMVLGMAGLELQAGRPREAAACLRRGLQKHPDDPDLLHTLADLLLQQGEDKEAGRLIARLRPDNSPASLAAYLHGRLLMQDRQWLEAARVLEEVTRDLDASAGLASRACLYLARCYEQTGDGDLRLGACAKAVELDPASWFARLQLGAAQLDAGRVGEALKQVRLVAGRPGAPTGAWTLLARGLVQRNLRRPPARRDWAEVGRALDRAGGSEAEAVPAAVLRADVCLAQNQPDQAQAVLKQAFQDYPDQVPLWVARANLALRRGEPETAIATLEEARRRLGDLAGLRLALIEFWARRGGREAVRPLHELEQDLDRFTAADRAGVLWQLAWAYYRLGNAAQAEKLARRLADQEREDLRSRLLLLDVALAAGRDEAVQTAVREVRKLEGDDGTWWRYGEAARLLLRGRRGDKTGLAQARPLLKELAGRRPTWPRVPLLEAYLAEVEGDAARSLAGYLKALELGERRPGVVARAVQLLVERGRYAEADQAIQKYQEQALLGPDLARGATHIALKAGDRDRALELARLAVPARSRGYRDQLWLGEVFAAAGRAAAAEAAYRRAAELGGRIPDAWVALVGFLARTGQADKAEAVLAGLPKRLAPGQLALAQARCYEALGRMDAAAERFQDALAKRPDDFLVLRGAAAFYLHTDQPARAEPLLRRLLDPAVVVPDGALAWTRRQLALVLAGAGGEANYRAALALLDANRTPAGETLADRRARALVEATRPDQRSAALSTLEELPGDPPLTPDEQLRLARLYEAAGDWPRAQAQMQSLLETDPLNPAYLVHAVRNLLARGRTGEARDLAARLAKLEPDSARTRELLEKVKAR
jgi:tetratricopeptide (TPR) repeat protein